MRFSLGIAETVQTQIDAQHARTWELSPGLDRMLSGVTASDEDFRAFCSDDVRRRGLGLQSDGARCYNSQEFYG